METTCFPGIDGPGTPHHVMIRDIEIGCKNGLTFTPTGRPLRATALAVARINEHNSPTTPHEPPASILSLFSKKPLSLNV
jgi:hypothetical protein